MKNDSFYYFGMNKGIVYNILFESVHFFCIRKLLHGQGYRGCGIIEANGKYDG